jgi:insulysin
MDRFSQFFIHPLFLEDTLDRELRSVDSEHKKNLQSDSWRMHQLQQNLSNPKHPFCHFSTGNWETLHDAPLAKGVDLRKEFMNFYETNYSANRMKLVVLGQESLDELEKWVIEMFSAVKNKNLPRNRWDGIPLYTEKEIGTQIFVKPVVDSRSVEIYFSYPDEELQYETQPGRYLSHLIGHEGPGSILSYLKEKGWANELSAGPQSLCPGTDYFNIHVRLTEEGLVHYQEVVKVVFQYIALLNKHEPLEWIFQELKNMSEVDFRFRQNISPSKTASSLSSVMQSPLPRNRLLSALSTLKSFDPVGIKTGLSYLQPVKARYVIASKFFPGDWDQKEKWYGTEYKYEKIPKDFEALLSEAMSSTDRPGKIHLPHPNEFIPTRLEVEKKEVPEPARYPKLIRNDSIARTWFKKDDQFWVPKASVTICMRSPMVYITPRCFVIGQLYTALVQDSLSEYSYDADIAGLEYSLANDSLGLDIDLYGYNDKMPVLLEKVLVSMRDLEVKEDRFNITKERLVRAIKNWHLKQPYQQVGHYRGWLCSDKTWLNEECFAEVETITPDDVRLFYPQVLKQLHFEIVAHGNLHKEDVLRFTTLLESTLKPKALPQPLWPSRRSLIVPEGSNFVYERQLADPENINHCIEYVLWAGSCHDRTLRSVALLAAQMADEPCYDQLRTKEQLGYVVWSSPIMTLNRVGFRVLVQSERNPVHLEARIEAFLERFGGVIEEMDAAKFEKHKASLVSKLREKPKNLREEMQRIYGYIANETFDFDQGKAFENIRAALLTSPQSTSTCPSSRP